ncbi:MAG: transcription termination factor NusA [Patescibacteria group bacterium]|nr:transcription termination factor NusA [Patescibacteria group bacterium]
MENITSAIKQICEEKNLSYDAVINTIESALAAAYRKDYGKKNQNIKVIFNNDVSKSKVFDVKTVVEDLPEEINDEDAKTGETKDNNKQKEKGQEEKADKLEAREEEEEERKFNPKTEMQLTDAKLIKKTAKIGDEIKIKLKVPEAHGRMAAQTAKQVIIQRLREAEREMVFNDFKSKEGEVVSGVIQRREGRIVLVDLNKTVGILHNDEQIPGEKYGPGERIKIYVKEVKLGPKGPEIILSRTAKEILKKIFYLEIPEISNGLIELKRFAREAGFRSKVAVRTDSENVDPIGSCVGQRGARIQTIINELGGEKVDIIEYDDDPIKFITNALSPAKVINIKIDKNENKAKVEVATDQLSLAIGKGGQNARLAAKLTGWKIDIIEAGSNNNDAKKSPDKKNENADSPKIETKTKEKEAKKKTSK